MPKKKQTPQLQSDELHSISASDMYGALEEHLTTLGKNINNLEGEDFDNACYGIVELAIVYIQLINTDIQLMEGIKGPVTRFKVPAHKLKRYRKYIKLIEDKMIDVADLGGDEAVYNTIRNVIKEITTPFVQTLMDLGGKEYSSYFDKFLPTNDATKKKMFTKTLNKMLEQTKDRQDNNEPFLELELKNNDGN